MSEIEKESKNINRKDFILKLGKTQKLGPSQVKDGFEGILNFFESRFKEDCIIELRGFGKFICKNGKVRFKSLI